MGLDPFNTQPIQTGVIAVMVIGLVEVIKYLLFRLKKQDDDKEEEINLKIFEAIEKNRKVGKDILEICSKCDSEGVPLVYTPRTCRTVQKAIWDKIEIIATHQEKTTVVLEGIVRTLERMGR